ncbi:Carnitine transport ATP-binding protein OpuCA [compost metagenome]
MQDEFIRLQKTLKKTIVFVTHDMDEALKMGDRIGVMKDGSMLQMDTPEKLLNEPAHGFVEDFIGKNRIFQNPEFITVKDIFRSNPAVALPQLSPSRAFAQMRQRKTDTLIAVNEQGHYLGIVSAYDLQAQMTSISTIQEVIHDEQFYLEESATAQDALFLINDAKHGIIPIINSHKVVIGVVTRASLLTTFANHWAGRKEQIDERLIMATTN